MPQQYPRILVYSAAALTAAYAGTLVAKNPQTMAMSLLALLAMGGLVVLVNLPVSVVFAGWLFLTPIFQASADAVALGRALTWALYIAPALLFAVLTVTWRRREIPFTALDWLPGAYLLYVVFSIFLTTTFIHSDPPAAAKSIVTLTALGPIVYYFLVFGPGLRVPVGAVAATLMAAASAQGLLAIVEIATGFNLWGQHEWLEVPGGARASGTLANPAITGMFLGVGICLAVAVLIHRGPRDLRRLAWLVLFVGTPALALTLTRGPIVATALAVVALLVLGRARLLGLGVLAAAALAIVALYPSLENTPVYQQRAANTDTIQARVVIRDVSLALAAERPVFGWGHGQFDEAKNASEHTARDIAISTVLATTSHDTYLTILVELGVVGLLLYATPFAVLMLRALRRRGPPETRWLLAGSLASLVVIIITGSTMDYRFFSFALMIPFVFLAVLRRLSAAPQPATAS